MEVNTSSKTAKRVSRLTRIVVCSAVAAIITAGGLVVAFALEEPAQKSEIALDSDIVATKPAQDESSSNQEDAGIAQDIPIQTPQPDGDAGSGEAVEDVPSVGDTPIENTPESDVPKGDDGLGTDDAPSEEGDTNVSDGEEEGDGEVSAPSDEGNSDNPNADTGNDSQDAEGSNPNPDVSNEDTEDTSRDEATQEPAEKTDTEPAEEGNTSHQRFDDAFVVADGVDVIPSWALSGSEVVSGNLAVAEEARVLEGQLEDRIQTVVESLGGSESIEVTHTGTSTLDVWAVYAALNNMEEDFPHNVEIPDAKAREQLYSIYWAMNDVSGSSVGGTCSVSVNHKSWIDVAGAYGLSERVASLETMVTPEAESALSDIYKRSIVANLTVEEFSDIEEELDGTEGLRRSVVFAALSLEGKVPYFYGGKTNGIGWNPSWGKMAIVSGDETLVGGSAEPYGLDCSGYVAWAFVNATGSVGSLPLVGAGTGSQWANSKTIDMADAQPGDLVFLAGPSATGANNHVGIVTANGEGTLTVAQCSGGADNVVVTDASGFKYARSPYVYGEEAA